MTDLTDAVKSLSRVSGEVSMATAFGGPTSKLRPILEGLQEAVQDVTIAMEEDDAPLLYLGWADDTTSTIPDTPEDLT